MKNAECLLSTIWSCKVVGQATLSTCFTWQTLKQTLNFLLSCWTYRCHLWVINVIRDVSSALTITWRVWATIFQSQPPFGEQPDHAQRPSLELLLAPVATHSCSDDIYFTKRIDGIYGIGRSWGSFKQSCNRHTWALCKSRCSPQPIFWQRSFKLCSCKGTFMPVKVLPDISSQENLCEKK